MPGREAPQVAFVSSHAESGGEELYLEQLISRLPSAWVAGVITLSEGPLVEHLEAGGADVEVVPAPARLGMVPAAFRLRGRLRELGPDVVHANGIKAALVCALASLRAPWKVIWVKHDLSWDGRLARFVARGCDLVVGVSATAVEIFGDDPKARVVSNGVVERDADPGAGRRLVEELCGEGGGPVVCLAGRVCPAKGQLDLVEAAPGVLDRVPGSRFLLLGGEDPFHPGHMDRVKARAAELGVADAVTVAGHVDPGDAVAAIGASDLLAAPSGTGEGGGWREGFGMAVAEAMWSGTPVVAYSTGSLPEVLGGCGRLVDEADRSELGKAIAEVLVDDRERERMAGCGRERARDLYPFERTVSGIRECYEEVVAGA